MPTLIELTVSRDRFCAERLTSLVRTLELTNLDEYHALQKIASFATLVATYEKGESRGYVVVFAMLIALRLGFLLILEPYETEHATVPNPIFHFVCVPLLSSRSSWLMMSRIAAAWIRRSRWVRSLNDSVASSSHPERFRRWRCIQKCWDSSR